MKPVFLFWRRPVFWFWGLLVSISAIVACFTPLLETLGYEYALLVSLVVSAGTGHIGVLFPKHARLAQTAPIHGVFTLYGGVLLTAAGLLVAPLLFSLLNALRVAPCNLWEGAVFYLLMPLFSAAFAGAVGLFWGLALASTRVASLAWFGSYLALLAASLVEFYTSPAVFLFGPLHGYFPGVLYDRVIRIEPRFLTYRLATTVHILFILSLAQSLFQPSSLRIGLGKMRWASRWVFVACGLGLLSIVLISAGPALGHRTNRSMLIDELSLLRTAPGLEVHLPPRTDKALAEELAADARFSLHQVQSYFDIFPTDTIHVFFFKDARQKARLMGAAGTNVAKPWRKAVYVVVDNAPHDILRHELAHVVAASFGAGPFDISGQLGGLWPNPGFIEGAAVAAQGPRGSLTTHQWAAAMKKLGLLPALESIFSFGFFGQNASSSYTAAGSFSAWVHSKFGPEALRRAYALGDWTEATGKPLRQLEKEWHTFIARISLKDYELEAASHRFDRPSIVHTKCVHEVARLETLAAERADERRWGCALHLLEQAHDISGESTRTRLGLFFSRLDAGVAADFDREAEKLLEDPAVAAVTKDTIREILADRLWKRGESSRAGILYRELAARAQTPSVRRTLEVKAHLTTVSPERVGHIIDVLARRPSEDEVPEGLAMLEIARLAEARPNDPIAAYLLGRQHVRYRNYGEALSYLERAMNSGLDKTTDSLLREGRLMGARCLFHLRRFDEARALFAELASDLSMPLGLREEAADWEQRCLFHKNLETTDQPQVFSSFSRTLRGFMTPL